MKQVVKVRVLPTDAEAAALKAILQVCNEAATWLSEEMYAKRVRHHHDAQKRFYSELRRRFGRSAQACLRRLALHAAPAA